MSQPQQSSKILNGTDFAFIGVLLLISVAFLVALVMCAPATFRYVNSAPIEHNQKENTKVQEYVNEHSPSHDWKVETEGAKSSAVRYTCTSAERGLAPCLKLTSGDKTEYVAYDDYNGGFKNFSIIPNEGLKANRAS